MSKTPQTCPDPIVEAVRERLLQRSLFGLRKYGTTIQDNPLTQQEWLQHAQDEVLDLANYLEKLKQTPAIFTQEDIEDARRRGFNEALDVVSRKLEKLYGNYITQFILEMKATT